MKNKLSLTLAGLALAVTGCSAGYANPYVPLNNQIPAQTPTSENNESYAEIIENTFIATADMPFSTFGADVDTAAYSIIRRKLLGGQLPDVNAVRIEEMLNYFDYNLPAPTGNDAISITTEVATAPWNSDHQLLMVGLKTPEIDFADVAPNNLVFLLDVSGSMSSSDKLPLLKSAIRLLVDELRPIDKLSMVVYAGAAGIILEGADSNDRGDILDALDRLEAGGSTAGGQGIQLAYQVAQRQWIEGGNNRVILATDGDFNVGTSSVAALEELITQKRESGIFLSVLGFGTGNLKDDRMEKLANKGNGVYHYIDTILEAKKVFVEELGSSLITVAKDVKLQLEFNPAHVKGYRLIGYENRMLSYDDFVDDTVDSGDMGAGHEVIAIYELIPAGSDEVIAPLTFDIPDDRRYTGENYLDELVQVSIRYKTPQGSISKLISELVPLTSFDEPLSPRMTLATSVAEFGLLLRQSQYRYEASYSAVIARLLPIADDNVYLTELLNLVRRANQLTD